MGFKEPNFGVDTLLLKFRVIKITAQSQINHYFSLGNTSIF